MGRLLLKLFVFGLLLFPLSSLGATTPVKILLVPGHDNSVWGAQYGNIKEADMNLRLATTLYNILKKDKRFEVQITRDSDGYLKKFSNYVASHEQEIISFRDNAKKANQDAIDDGDFIVKQSVPHNNASNNTSVILYGINKWANENKMDAVIHIHFNDYPRSNKWKVGEYKGFAIYFPEGQRVNAKESVSLAKNIFTQLRKKYSPSTYPEEQGGLIEDQTLIALGSNDTLTATVRSVLIEYGYIYRFSKKAMRHKFYTSAANLTATGIKNSFFGK